mmetsp:Transcript_149620/g.480252  ORF Transcript_149620/g.480252 Transcript_149620/m.480252 type:complete len:327 (-) Transcript_149620:3375-4355(-)
MFAVPAMLAHQCRHSLRIELAAAILDSAKHVLEVACCKSAALDILRERLLAQPGFLQGDVRLAVLTPRAVQLLADLLQAAASTTLDVLPVAIRDLPLLLQRHLCLLQDLHTGTEALGVLVLPCPVLHPILTQGMELLLGLVLCLLGPLKRSFQMTLDLFAGLLCSTFLLLDDSKSFDQVASLQFPTLGLVKESCLGLLQLDPRLTKLHLAMRQLTVPQLAEAFLQNDPLLLELGELPGQQLAVLVVVILYPLALLPSFSELLPSLDLELLLRLLCLALRLRQLSGHLLVVVPQAFESLLQPHLKLCMAAVLVARGRQLARQRPPEL